MTCTWVEGNLSAYFDGELPLSVRRRIRRHLQTCTRCHERIQGFLLVRDKIRRVRFSIPSGMFDLFIQFLLWTQPDAPDDESPPEVKL